MTALRSCISFSLLLILTGSAAEAAGDAAANVRAQGLAAYKAGNYHDYLAALEKLSVLRPNQPDVALRLAAAQARIGRTNEAIATLQAIADMGVSVDLAADPRNSADFSSLAQQPAFLDWQTRNAANAAPLITSTPVHEMHEAALLTEDIALDSETGDLYVTSVLQHALLRIGKDGREQRVPLAAPEQKWNLLAVAIDGPRHRLWLTAQAIRGFPGIRASDAGHAQLSVYDLRSGQRIATWAFKPKGNTQAAIGDIALAPNGDLLISDSAQGVVCRVDAGLRHLTVLARGLVSPQDIAFSPDGQHAFVADYARGIAEIDLASGTRRWLTAARGIALTGIDGLYSWRRDLIAVQNGVHPSRVLRLRLDESQTSLIGFDVLDRAVPGEPTHGVIDGDSFIYISNAGWNHLSEQGTVMEGEALTPAVLRRLRLP